MMRVATTARCFGGQLVVVILVVDAGLVVIGGGGATTGGGGAVEITAGDVETLASIAGDGLDVI
jgi:hypothetical protein